MAPLFSKVDLNKLWHDVQNEETLICAKFGKDLFNISEVIGRKKVAQFFDSQCMCAQWHRRNKHGDRARQVPQLFGWGTSNVLVPPNFW